MFESRAIGNYSKHADRSKVDIHFEKCNETNNKTENKN